MKVEEIADNVFALSTIVPVTNRSWLPANARGFEPFNVYLARSDNEALLIDTGPPAHRESLLSVLDNMLGSRRLTVMVTRSELECISNVGAIVARFPVSRVLGTMKNLPILGLVHLENPQDQNVPADRIVVGQSLEEYGFGRLWPMEPVIKTLSTVWMIDDQDEILFTSDFFSADLLSEQNDSVLRRKGDPPSRAYIGRHVLTKFDWLARADTSRLADAWDRFFTNLRPRIIAPGLGRIQFGRDLVAQTIEDYRAAVFGSARFS